MNFRCGARFDFASSEIKDTIIQLGGMKLLGGVPYTHQSLNNHQTLACLAQWLPIEFRSTMYFEQYIRLALGVRLYLMASRVSSSARGSNSSPL